MYRWVDHTAEVELSIEAGSERDVFADGLAALGELLGASAPGAASALERREISVEARDRPALLAGWLEELVFLAETEGFVATDIAALMIGPNGLAATVEGFIGAPPPLVKAVTYHRLTFQPAGRGYVATVVLDV